ncbi:MAG TPA: hypothetical protein VHB99_10920 [Pirellulales bacterium]|nr:hypothetical protein [Pirellulales bacterium]
MRVLFFAIVGLLLSFAALPCSAAEPGKAKVYVVLWFDTEDYLLPASDDAALRVADFLTGEKIRATFKVVGEKARTLERRERFDVIAALKKHEIGYHSNYHSVQPSPAIYCSTLGWDDGVAEFERREGPGLRDVERIFAQKPSCYGQPGSSWTPQSFGAIRHWSLPVYLDAGNHVRLDDKPHYYCGVLTLYKLAHTLRTGLGGESELLAAQDRFQSARQALLAEGGGLVSIYYHPCEFVHKQFWDGVNFNRGANPPRSAWKPPPAKTPEESRLAYDIFERYIRFIHGFEEVEFITATQAAKLYRDRALGREFAASELKSIAAAVAADANFQMHGDYALSASEVFWLLNEYVARTADGEKPAKLALKATPLGPAEPTPQLNSPVATDASQFARTAADVSDFIARHGRLPPTVWLGSLGIPPESYLPVLAREATRLLEGKPLSEKIEIAPAKLAAADYVADDGPNLWGWVILPPGFRAPAMMELAKRQAWTIKPALPGRTE